jgi:hypothetical protein
MKLFDIYDCGCYINGTCVLSKKQADCPYYEKCTSGGKPPVLVDDIKPYITDNI